MRVSVLFIILVIGRWWDGMLLYQVLPSFFVSRMDGFTWLFMYTGLHKLLLNNYTAWVISDLLFCIMPVVFLSFTKHAKSSKVVAWLWVLVNWVYIQCYTLYPTNSIEVYLAWLLLPFLVTCTTLKGFYLTLHFFRYIFLWFMLSAGLWKIWQHGIFNIEEMSGILYMQHKEFLATSPHSRLADFYYWLIYHATVSYMLYAASLLVELSFLVGFFTRRYDNWLIILSLLFFAMDVLVMRISYWEMLPFLVTLYYSKLSLPEAGHS